MYYEDKAEMKQTGSIKASKSSGRNYRNGWRTFNTDEIEKHLGTKFFTIQVYDFADPNKKDNFGNPECIIKLIANDGSKHRPYKEFDNNQNNAQQPSNAQTTKGGTTL